MQNQLTNLTEWNFIWIRDIFTWSTYFHSNIFIVIIMNNNKIENKFKWNQLHIFTAKIFSLLAFSSKPRANDFSAWISCGSRRNLAVKLVSKPAQMVLQAVSGRRDLHLASGFTVNCLRPVWELQLKMTHKNNNNLLGCFECTGEDLIQILAFQQTNWKLFM